MFFYFFFLLVGWNIGIISKVEWREIVDYVFEFGSVLENFGLDWEVFVWWVFGIDCGVNNWGENIDWVDEGYIVYLFRLREIFYRFFRVNIFKWLKEVMNWSKSGVVSCLKGFNSIFFMK